MAGGDGFGCSVSSTEPVSSDHEAKPRLSQRLALQNLAGKVEGNLLRF